MPLPHTGAYASSVGRAASGPPPALGLSSVQDAIRRGKDRATSRRRCDMTHLDRSDPGSYHHALAHTYDGAFARERPEPPRVDGRQVHAAVAVPVAEGAVPEGAVERGARREPLYPGHVLDGVAVPHALVLEVVHAGGELLVAHAVDAHGGGEARAR